MKNPNIGQLDRQQFITAHNNSMFVQFLFSDLPSDGIKPDTFAYPPCWGALDAGMTMEKHSHPTIEFYVFTQGAGVMVLGDESFPVQAGVSVNIPPGIDHEVTNPESAAQPLVWVSIGLIP